MLKSTVLSLKINFLSNLRECKRFSVRRLLKEFSSKWGKKRTLNGFLRKLGKITSTERTAVSGRLFLYYFQFHQVKWRHSQVEVSTCLVEYLFQFPTVQTKIIKIYQKLPQLQSIIKQNIFAPVVMRNFHDVLRLTVMTSSSY